MDPEPLPDVLVAVSPAILASSAKIGGASGIFGLCLGGVVGTIKKTTPLLFALATGIQCSAIGASWSATKSYADVYQARKHGTDVFSLTDKQLTRSHTAAGTITGGLVAAVFRGRSNVLPGMVVFGLAGFIGSNLLSRNIIENSHDEVNDLKPGIGHRILHSRYNPMKVLSDAEYQGILEEKLIRVEAEIALIDENIQKIKTETPDAANSVPE